MTASATNWPTWRKLTPGFEPASPAATNPVMNAPIHSAESDVVYCALPMSSQRAIRGGKALAGWVKVAIAAGTLLTSAALPLPRLSENSTSFSTRQPSSRSSRCPRVGSSSVDAQSVRALAPGVHTTLLQAEAADHPSRQAPASRARAPGRRTRHLNSNSNSRQAVEVIARHDMVASARAG